MTDAIVLGAGGHAKVVISTIESSGSTVRGVYDDNPARLGQIVLGVPVRGTIQQATTPADSFAIIAVGDNAARRRIAARSNLRWGSAVHARAFVHASTRIAEGSAVFAGAVVQPDARIGRHAIINTGALLDHDANIGDFAHICPGAVLAGTVTVEEGAFVGSGAVVCPNLRIGAWSIIGAGAVVTKDVPAGTRALGIPARGTPIPIPEKI